MSVNGPEKNSCPCSFQVDAVPPFRLDLTAWALRRRADNAIDRWDGQTYRRVLQVNRTPVEVAVTQTQGVDAPQLEVAIDGVQLTPAVRSAVTGTLDLLLGLSLGVEEFHRFARGDARLGLLAQRFRGLKPPRFPTLWEALVNGIACQQLTLTLGIRLLNRLAEHYGARCASRRALAYAFPDPADLCDVPLDALRRLGFSGQKARAITELARSAAERPAMLGTLAELGDAQCLERLMQLRGIGRWTAEYVLLRGLGRVHVFPGDDVGARRNLQRWLGIGDALDYEAVRRTLAPWRPYAGLIYFHLLLQRLAESECLQ